MDLRTYYVQAAEAAAAAVHAAEGDVLKLTPKAMLLKLEVQGVGLDDADDGPALPRYGKILSGHGNGVAAAVVVDNDGVRERGSARDLTCPECGKAFLSDKAMYGHLRSHPERGYKGANRPATAAVGSVAGDTRPRRVPRKEAAGISTRSPAADAVARDKTPRNVPWKEAELSTVRSVTAKRGPAPHDANAGISAAPVAVPQSICSEEEEAAMILLEMSSRSPPPEPYLPWQPTHVGDAFVGHHMPGVEQPELPDHVADAVAMHHIPDVEPPELPDQVAVADDGQYMWGAEKPAQVEHVFKIIIEPQAPEAEQAVRTEHAAVVTGVPQSTQVVKLPTKLDTVADDVLADKPVSPAGAKKSKKRRLQDLEQAAPASPPPPEVADVKPPARRIPSPASDRRYGCPTCQKTFPTHQALGGHMASHNRVKNAGGAQHADGLAMAQAAHNNMAHHHHSQGGGNVIIAGAGGIGEERWDAPPAPMVQGPVQHPCTRCHLIFPSGQALGGHMRKHWLADKQKAAEEKEEAAADEQEAAAAPTGVPHDFDLNELPMEGNEGEN